MRRWIAALTVLAMDQLVILFVHCGAASAGLKPDVTVSRVDLPEELVGFESVLVRRIRPCLGLTPVSVTGPLPPLSTKLGGLPDLPPGASWPIDPDDEPLPFVFQLNLTDLAEQFAGLLPWPGGGGLVQLFTNGDDTGVKALVHRDLAVLRPAESSAERYAEYRLYPFESANTYDPALRPAYDNASEQALAEDWQLVCMLSDDHRVPEEFACGGGFYMMAPPDATGRWDIDRLQTVYQCT